MDGDYPVRRIIYLLVLFAFLIIAMAMLHESYKILILGIEPYSGKGYAALPGALVFTGLTIWFWMNRKGVSNNVMRINNDGIGFGNSNNYQFFKWKNIKEISISGSLGYQVKIEAEDCSDMKIASFNTLVYQVDSDALLEHLKDRAGINNFSLNEG
ncbi:hypothetical protein EYS14_24820 [Alteromonadaceae bacterium M269]|nr:hypothetical protein EYS14_24820 [Alteromonadaceae bacterium M269]